MRELEGKSWKDATEDKEPPHPVVDRPALHRKGRKKAKAVPGTNCASTPTMSTSGENQPDGLVQQLTQEGGVGFVMYLLNRAVSIHDDLSDMSNIREWTLRDILKLPYVTNELVPKTEIALEKQK